MSEDKPQDVPVTTSMLNQWGEGFAKVIVNEVSELVKQNNSMIKDEILKEVSINNSAQIDPIHEKVNYIFNAINGASQQQQPQQQIAPQVRTRLDVSELMSALQQAVQAYAQVKSTMQSENSEVDTIAQILAKGMLREVVMEGKRRARIGLKKGTILPEEVEGIIDTKIERNLGTGGASHEPIL